MARFTVLARGDNVPAALGSNSVEWLRPTHEIAPIPHPERTGTRHSIVSGTTGSGKTALIADLVAQIRAVASAA